MFVLKGTRDKVLAALQAVAGIIERRHTQPILAGVLINRSKSLAAIFNAGPENLRLVRLLPLRKHAPKTTNAHPIVACARALAGLFSQPSQSERRERPQRPLIRAHS
ncbi:hypothetical protein [Kinneretia aquatilis]|uniref:hypothetical protein n=1 Tax=Kinneretia aquatilis TaxID=2070761 RepID=UPI00149525D1